MNSYKSMEDGDNPAFSGKTLESLSVWPAEHHSQVSPSRWSTHVQLHFLVINTFNKTESTLLRGWLSVAYKAPQFHFERLLSEVKFWSGEQST
ncbi:hypothetical protein [Pseudomonas sp. ML2-2023-3]|uniref:hypothetical protein n=1 Tax=Pseudomonas sp. ML2-2023-3 TaxID=3122375 RepID=UPI0030CE5902